MHVYIIHSLKLKSVVAPTFLCQADLCLCLGRVPLLELIYSLWRPGIEFLRTPYSLTAGSKFPTQTVCTLITNVCYTAAAPRKTFIHDSSCVVLRI